MKPTPATPTLCNAFDAGSGAAVSMKVCVTPVDNRLENPAPPTLDSASKELWLSHRRRSIMPATATGIAIEDTPRVQTEKLSIVMSASLKTDRLR